MREVFFFLFVTLLCSFTLNDLQAASCPPIGMLPWVNEKDENAMHRAIPFLSRQPIILEAGVCGAEDTRCFKRQWPDSVIYGFEAHPEHFKRASAATRGLKNVFLYEYALCDHVGTTTFYCSKKIGGASSILSDNLRNVENIFNVPISELSYHDVPITVQCTTVDHWAKKANVSVIDYIWLDAEGAELYILQNAKTILPSVKVISIEVNFQEFRKGMTLFPKLYEFLTENGFSLKCIWGNSRWQSVGIFVNDSNIHTQSASSQELVLK